MLHNTSQTQDVLIKKYCNQTDNSPTHSSLDMTIHLLPAVHQFAYEQENILLSQVKTNRFPSVNETLNNLLGYTLVTGRNSLLNSRQRIPEFYSVMTRALIETGIADHILMEFHDIYNRMQQTSITYEQLCEIAQQMAGFFVQTIGTAGPQNAGQSAVNQARGYMTRHYASRITLAETAAYVHLNPAYFSSIFKQISGNSFKEYLNKIRIEESRLLLKNSNYALIDIAIATGFEDQSYFTKTFKKYTGMTPGQYRQL